jgi:D-alanyl-lipoteichoic acid acyltransferase DltB (MBOAT superfamily)
MSLWFYGYFNPSYVGIICGSILGNFWISRLLLREKARGRRRVGKVCMLFGVLANVALLFYFKYFDFFLENINAAFSMDFTMRNIVLPLGISFFTFQQISYVVDSYRGETEKYSLLDYAVFVAFFPQLVAGPIVLHGELISQLRDETKHRPNAENLAKGLHFFAVGLFKKVIIADTLGNMVALGFGGVEILTTVDVLLVIVAYALQLYFDFSGYSDMASGIAALFNIRLPINFNSPYKAKSILEFWDRWHMTLTRFLRQYIYFPLGGSRKGRIRTYLNIMIVFTVSGFWHGANWTFVVWGALHGLAEVLTRRFRNTWSRLPSILQWFLTFGFVSCAFLIFRADSLNQVYIMFRKVAKVESLAVTETMLESLTLPEIAHLEKLLHIDGLFEGNAIHLCIFLFLVLYMAVGTKNCQEKKFVCNGKTLVTTVGMLVWSMVSLSGISTFLYFNF